MKFLYLTLMIAAANVFAQAPVRTPAQTSGSTANAEKPALTLEQYLEQVKTQNPEARSMREQLAKAELRLNEAEVSLSSEFYGRYNFLDDKNEATQSMAPSRIQNSTWRIGVKDPTTYGLTTDVYFETARNKLNINPAIANNPQFTILTDYEDTKAGVDIRQSLWRNGFGAATRAGVEMQRAASRIELLKRQFELKNLLLKSENAYWTLVSLNQIVRLQEENVGRAKKLFDWMQKRVGMRLVDDVDGLQAQASYEMRDLELQTSLDERAQLARQFNMMRGSQNDAVETLSELPDPTVILQGVKEGTNMTREDFRMIYEQASIGQYEAKAAKSQIAPQLDLVAGVATNGLDNARSRSFEEIQDLRNPTWNVGIQFSIPLDYSLIGNMRRSYKAASNAADALKDHAAFSEERTWHDLLTQKTEAQRRFERSLALEKTQTLLVKRERDRLLNGRTTTFQAITIEQNLSAAQIQRVRSQVGLIQIHNLLKNWEVRK